MLERLDADHDGYNSVIEVLTLNTQCGRFQSVRPACYSDRFFLTSSNIFVRDNASLPRHALNSRLESALGPIANIPNDRWLNGLVASSPVYGYSNGTVMPLDLLHEGILDFDTPVVRTPLTLQKIGNSGRRLFQNFEGNVENTVLVAVPPDADQQHVGSEGKLLEYLID